MVLTGKTKQKYGYDVKDLARTTTKPIWVKCDYCQKEYESSPKRRDTQNKILAKDACKACRYKKRDELGIIKYGAKNPFQWKHVQEKAKQTNLEKYGCEYACQNEEIKQKIGDAIEEKFGVRSASQCPEIREKAKKTLQDRYGVDSPLEHEAFKEKAQQTMLEKYGATSYIGSEEGKERIRQTNQEKYGVDNVFQNEDIKAKINQSRINSGNIKIYEKQTVEEWATKLGYSRSGFNDLVNRHGFEIAAKMSPQMSSLECRIREFLNLNNIPFKSQAKIDKTGGGYYLADFVVDDVAIECDGLYWHSDYIKDDKEYHFKKRLDYQLAGYKPLFFREDEINEKFDAVASVILNKLGMSKRVMARKTDVKEVSKEEASAFMNEFHLMGDGRGVTYGLYYNNELVSIMQAFMYNSSEDLEISRFCCRSGYSVVGGFSKLLKRHINHFCPKTVTNRIDCRYGTGDFMSALGFEFVGCSPSFQWTDFKSRWHRLKFHTDEEGYDHGFAKIWDCGQAKYVKRL